MENDEVNWNQAIDGKYVKINDGESKVLFLRDWKLVKVIKQFKNELSGELEDKELVEFKAVCTSEDGVIVDKLFNSTSNRLKEKLRPRLENANPSKGMRLRITRNGVANKTQFVVNEEVLVGGKK